MRFEPQAFKRVGSFQTEQATTDNNAAFDAFGAGTDSVEIGQCAIHQTMRLIVALNGGYKWIGTRGEHDGVVAVVAFRRNDFPLVTINVRYLFIQMKLDLLFHVLVGGAHRQIGVR